MVKDIRVNVLVVEHGKLVLGLDHDTRSLPAVGVNGVNARGITLASISIPHITHAVYNLAIGKPVHIQWKVQLGRVGVGYLHPRGGIGIGLGEIHIVEVHKGLARIFTPLVLDKSVLLDKSHIPAIWGNTGVFTRGPTHNLIVPHLNLIRSDLGGSGQIRYVDGVKSQTHAHLVLI